LKLYIYLILSLFFFPGLAFSDGFIADDCRKSKQEFIEELTKIVKEKSWGQFELKMSSSFQSSFGPESSKKEFIKQWNPNSPKSEFWVIVSRALSFPYQEYTSLNEEYFWYEDSAKQGDPSNYRLMLKCNANKWEITSFLSGD
jgi:hypothetical protein